MISCGPQAFSKTKPETNHKNVNSTKDQSELEGNICNDVKRQKKRASEARLVLVLFLIGWESGANFVNHSQSVVKQNQTKREITFDTQLKTVLPGIQTS